MREFEYTVKFPSPVFICGQRYEVKVIIGVLAGIVRFLLQYQESTSVES